MAKYVEAGPKNIILDLATIDFVDSSGLGALVQLVKKATTDGGTVQVVTDPNGETGTAREVFVATALGG